MRVPVLLFGLTVVPCLTHAACPAAPVGKPSDGVVQFVTDGTAGFGPTSTLDATREGSMVYDSGANQVKYCDGTVWNSLLTNNAATVPTGAVMAFALASCPTGWTEYTPARGRFLRGIDNGAGNDPDGNRALGNVQADALQNISGAFNARSWNASSAYSALWSPSGAFAIGGDTETAGSLANTTNAVGKSFIFDASRVARTANETRPKNVALLFCRKT